MTATALPLTAPDIVCLDDMDPFADDTASDLETLEQDVLHMLIEDAGSNPDDPDRGIGIETLLGGTTVDLNTAINRINTGLQQDDRITKASASVTLDVDGVTYLIAIAIEVNKTLVTFNYKLSPTGGLTTQ